MSAAVKVTLRTVEGFVCSCAPFTVGSSRKWVFTEERAGCTKGGRPLRAFLTIIEPTEKGQRDEEGKTKG